MEYLTMSQVASKWNITERSLKNYCENGRIKGAMYVGKTWVIPDDAVNPEKYKRGFSENELLNIIKEQKDEKIKDGIYDKIMIELTVNACRIGGNPLSREQIISIIQTEQIEFDGKIAIRDVMDVINFKRAVDYTIDNALVLLSKAFITDLHLRLTNGTEDWNTASNYRTSAIAVEGYKVVKASSIEKELGELLRKYEEYESKDLEIIANFHKYFEEIHPYKSASGRTGMLIALKECLINDVVPFIIDEEHKQAYFDGLKENGDIEAVCLERQREFKRWLDDYKIYY